MTKQSIPFLACWRSSAAAAARRTSWFLRRVAGLLAFFAALGVATTVGAQTSPYAHSASAPGSAEGPAPASAAKFSPSTWSQTNPTGRAVLGVARSPVFVTPTPPPAFPPAGPLLPPANAAPYPSPVQDYASPTPAGPSAEPTPAEPVAPEPALAEPPPMPAVPPPAPRNPLPYIPQPQWSPPAAPAAPPSYALPPPPIAPAPNTLPYSAPPSAPYALPPGAPVSPYVTTQPPAVNSPPPAGEPSDKIVSEEIIEVDEEPPKLWSGSFDMGLNGSEGNSRLINVRFNAQAKRATPFNELTLKSNYIFSRTNSEETAHRLFFDGRDEWLAQASRWTIYIHGTTEYDEFQAWDARISGDAGLGYRFLKTDLTTFTGRIGPGASREFGGPSNDWTPELVFNLQAEHQLSTRQKITLQADYFPDPGDWSSYRINSQASWALVIDEERNLSLKLSAIDRYDSESGDKKPNDLDYAATLLWSF